MSSDNDKKGIPIEWSLVFPEKHEKLIRELKDLNSSRYLYIFCVCGGFVLSFVLFYSLHDIFFKDSFFSDVSYSSIDVIIIRTITCGILFSATTYFLYLYKDKKPYDNNYNELKKQYGIWRHEKMKQERKSVINYKSIGDIIIKGNEAPVFIDSDVTNSFNNINIENEELGEAIKILAGFIEKSENNSAAVIFNELHKQLAGKDKNKTLIKSLWDSLVNILPAVKDLVSVTTAISKFF